MIEQRDEAIKKERGRGKENGNGTFLSRSYEIPFARTLAARVTKTLGSSEASFLFRLLRVTGCDASRFEILFRFRTTRDLVSLLFLSLSLSSFPSSGRLNPNAP